MTTPVVVTCPHCHSMNRLPGESGKLCITRSGRSTAIRPGKSRPIGRSYDRRESNRVISRRKCSGSVPGAR